jgi:hypothetical protein
VWDEQDFDSACLECHTTGYSPATGAYSTEGVSCTACHGEIPADHPASPVDVSIANEACADCHTVTFAEFRASLHEATGLACTSCHYAHTNGLRLEDEVTQCTNCHSHQLDDFAHASHVDAGLNCRHCHGYVEPGLGAPVDGLAPTGHDFQERVTACLDCHDDFTLSPVNGQIDADSDEAFSPGQAGASFAGGEEAALQIAELETTVETLVLQNRNASAIRLMQGGVGGLVVGTVAVWLVTRRMKGLNGNNGGNDGEDGQ